MGDLEQASEIPFFVFTGRKKDFKFFLKAGELKRKESFDLNQRFCPFFFSFPSRMRMKSEILV